MKNMTEKTKQCAVETLKKLGYDIEETEPTVVASTYPEDEQFSVFLDLARLSLELKNPSLIENPDVRRRLQIMNRRFQLCLKGGKS